MAVLAWVIEKSQVGAAMRGAAEVLTEHTETINQMTTH